MTKQQTLRAQANETAAVATAMIVACAYATSGETREKAEKAIWNLWGQPKYDANITGVCLTFGMADAVLDEAFHEYSAFEANAKAQASADHTFYHKQSPQTQTKK